MFDVFLWLYYYAKYILQLCYIFVSNISVYAVHWKTCLLNEIENQIENQSTLCLAHFPVKRIRKILKSHDI